MLKDGTGPVLGSHGGGQASPACARAGHPGTGSPCPPLLAHRCGGTGGEDAHVAEHTTALPTLTCSTMATTGTSTARGAAARLLLCPSNKHSTSSNNNEMRKGSLCFPPLCCFLLFSSVF